MVKKHSNITACELIEHQCQCYSIFIPRELTYINYKSTTFILAFVDERVIINLSKQHFGGIL